MVAVVSGSGLGLFNSSASSLGGDNNGNSQVGRGRDRVHVNSTTGNLIVQSVDETLSALGLDYATVRTYNSQGLTDEDNGDQWRLGVHMRLSAVTGGSGVNTDGSRITKTFGDGAEVVYTYNTTRSRYESTDGDGANDFLIWNGSVWTWTDGSSRVTEQYELISGVERIRYSRDADNNTVSYNYTGSLLTSMNMANPGSVANNAQTITFTYEGALGTNLTAVNVTSWNGTTLATQTLTSYTYDTSNRLETVRVDLTPANSSDSVTYTTTYTYEPGSKRIASITQSDGSSVSFSYLNINGGYRLHTVRDAENRVTTFTYEDVIVSGGTQQTAPANPAQVTNQDTANLQHDLRLNTLVRGEQQTNYTPYPLNINQLTTPPGAGSWGPESTLEQTNFNINSPRIAYANNGNGVAAWREGSAVYVQRYTASTNTWGTITSFNNGSGAVGTLKLAMDAASGSAMIAWTQTAGTSETVSAAYLSASGTWTPATGFDSTTVSSPIFEDNISVAVFGTRGAVSYVYNTAVSGEKRVELAMFNSGVLLRTPDLIDNVGYDARYPSVAIDSNGNAIVGWQEAAIGGGERVYYNRWNNTAQTFSGAQILDTSVDGGRYAQIAYDAQGNAMAVWRQWGGLWARRMLAGTSTWDTAFQLQTLPNNPVGIKLAMDTAGNAIVGWTQSDGSVNSMYARIFSASTGTWGSVALLENDPAAVTGDDYVTVAINGSRAIAGWLQTNGSRYDVYAARFENGEWLGRELMETRAEATSMLGSGIDGAGNAAVTWLQADGWARSMWLRRYTAGSGSGTRYYSVPASATWRSIAATLYGIDSDAAGTALQNAMPAGTSIAAGSQLLETSLPGTLEVPYYTTVPDYYLVPGIPATPTWRSIAAVVYGIDSPAAGTALQTVMQSAYPALTVGLRIMGLPPSIQVPTQITLPYYYHVVQSADWATTVQTIYGVSDPGLIEAVKTYSGVQTATLTVGSRLNVQQNQLYTVGGTGSGPAIYQRTHIDDPLNLRTTYTKDAQGRLVGVATPVAETRYTYHAVTGNVETITQDPNGLNRVTTFIYDPNTGLLKDTRDSLGNTVSRTYNSNNQLETETSFLGRDPDGANPQPATSPLTSRYFYDGQNHLRYAVSADGRVTEHLYNARGQRTTTYKYAANKFAGPFTEAELNSWAPAQRGSALELTEYEYDFRGNVELVRKYETTNASGAGTGTAWTSRFTYDQRGQLVSTVEAFGEATGTPTNDYVTSYTYDGLGRSLQTTSWVSGTVTAREMRSIQYLDSTQRTVTTFAGGRTQTDLYNRAGDLISVTQGPLTVGSTIYTYDANGRERVTTDAAGVKTFCFYDDAGRKIGYVDGDGTLTELIYNRAHQVVKTVSYATRLSSTTMTSLGGTGWNTIPFGNLRNEANPAATAAANHIALSVYDASGAVVYLLEQFESAIPNLYSVTQNVYDGAGRLTDQIRYAGTQSVAPGVDELLPSAITVSTTNPDNRRTRLFYNADGQLTATLDGAGYLKENIYDAAGRLITAIGYSNPSDPSRWATGTLDTLRPGPGGGTAQLDPVNDIHTRFFYDAQGRKIGELDGERYFTEFTHDVTTNVRRTIRYDKQLTDTSGTTSFGDLKASALTALKIHTTRYTYNGLGQVRTETNFENTETFYDYDVAGNLITTTRANNVSTQARTTQARYDVLGRLEQELSAEGSAALAALGATPTPAQIEDVWSRFGVRYTYDNLGHRTSMTVRPNDTQTNVTWFYYDNDGRLRFELDPRGRVTENRYDAYGQLVDRIEYWQTVSISNPQGGLLNDTLIGQLTQTGAANVHEKTTYAYTLRGQIKSTLSAAGATTEKTYNVFGEIETSKLGDFTALSYTYDARGMQKLTRRGTLTLEDRTFDAFGRLKMLTDRGNTNTITYDRLGRQITTSQSGDANTTLTSYDAFSRVYDVRDKLLNTTSYRYDETTRTVTVTTPEGIIVTTVHNVHGDTVSVTANGNTTSYDYHADGRLKTASDSLGALESRKYDRAGRQIEAGDARGTITTFAYDASNRLLSRTVESVGGDPALVTSYAYDTTNRWMTVTEPGSRVTRTEYDRDGRVAATVVEPGANQTRVDYVYDAANNTTLVTEGTGGVAGTPIRRTLYVFDAAGRRTDEYVDPSAAPYNGTLNLRTQYAYDDNDNLVRKIDAENNSTWYVYDAQHRLRQTIDALGGVTELKYDAEDRVVETRRYYTGVTPNFGNTPTFQAVTTTVNDHVTRSVYDRDGREKYTIDTLRATGSPGAVTEYGVVTERTFDASGNVTRTRVYRNEITVPVNVDLTSVTNAINHPATGNSTSTVHVDDHIERNSYDLRGRLEIKIDGSGAVTKYQYDLNGNVTQQTEYANTVPVDGAARVHHVNGSNHSLSRHLGYFAAGEVLTATVRFKSAPGVTGMMFLGSLAPYTNYVQTPSTAGNDGWQTLTLTLTTNRTDHVYVYVYADYYNSNSTATVLYDDLTVTSNTRGTLVAEKFDSLADGWGVSGQAEIIPVTLDDLGSDVAIRGFVNSLASSAQDRVTKFWYDKLDRQRFSLDAEGYLVETKYLDSANQEQQIVYAAKPSIAANATTEQVASAANTADPLNQTTTQTFDAAGRVIQVTDANGRSEYFGYDGVGNKTRYVNKKGTSANDTAYTWTYEYDANHRLTFERSPTVSVTAIDPNTLAHNTANQQIVTRNEYDRLGNVRDRTEAYGTTQARVTSFEYDALGRQTAMVSPTVGIYNPGNGAPGTGDGDLGAAAPVQRREIDTRIRSETTYDVFGNAYRNRLVTAAEASIASAGAHTYKVYDNLGRVKYEIDAKNQLTSYGYDTFGNKTTVTRHADPLGSAPTPTASGIALSQVSFTPGAHDRTITTAFDRLGRATRILQPSVANYVLGVGSFSAQPTVEHTYNAFGQVVKSRELTGSNTWATSYFYYDRRGLKVAELDASRYLTRYFYDDETGDLKRVIEYARPTTGTADITSYGDIVASDGGNASGDDREATFEYDKLNRKIGETKVSIESSSVDGSGGLNTVFNGSQTTTYGYDVLGNQTRVTVVDPVSGGAVNTYTFFDVLGRAIAIAQPARNPGAGASITPYIQQQRNAHGDLVRQIEYYDSPGSAPVEGTLPTAPAGNAALNRVTTMVVDGQGNLIRSQDATLANRYASYNIRGELAKEWQVVVNPNLLGAPVTDTIVTIYRYDALGQQTDLVESQRYDGTTPVTVTRKTDYNAFGEVTAKYNLGAAPEEKQYFHYDQAGRVWRTNAEDGVDKVYMYDLQGNATVELRSKSANLGSGLYDSAASVLADVSTANLMRTETAYDLRGNIIERRMPSFEVSTGISPVGANLQLTNIGGIAYITWNGTLAETVTESFEYRIAASNGTWASLDVVQVSPGVVGARVHDTYNNSYEFRIRYTRGTDSVMFAESTGTFRVDRGINTYYAISPTLPDTSNDIPPLNIQVSGPNPTASTYNGTAGWNGSAWQNENSVIVDFGNIGSGNFKFVVQYKNTNQNTSEGTWTTVDLYRDVTSTSLDLRWSEPTGPLDRGGIYNHASAPISVAVWGGPGYSVLLAAAGAPPGPPMLIWNAPADTSITATFRYKRTVDSGWSSVQAERFGGSFRVPVQSLLTQNSPYNFEVEYLRQGEVLSRRGGILNSTGVVQNTVISNASLGADSQLSGIFTGTIATPNEVGLDLRWTPPNLASLDPNLPFVAKFEYNLNGGTYTEVGIQPVSGLWSVALGSQPIVRGQTYGYRITYTHGARLVAEQIGTFSITNYPEVTTTTINTHTPGATPTQLADLGALTGQSNIAGASGSPYGTAGWNWSYEQWTNSNYINLAWQAIGNRSVVIELRYQLLDRNGTPVGSPTGGYFQFAPMSNVSSGANLEWSENQRGNSTGTTGGINIWGGVTVTVWGQSAAGQPYNIKLRETGATGSGATPRLTWTAPSDASLVGQLAYSGAGGSGTLAVTPGTNYVDLGNLQGSFNFTLSYRRPNESTPVLTRSGGSFTTNGITSSITNQGTASNANTAPLTVNHGGNSLSWNRPAAGSSVTFRYRIWNSGHAWSTDRQPPPGQDPIYTVSLHGLQSQTYEYEVEYRTGTQPAAAFATGRVALTTSTTLATDVLDANWSGNGSWATVRIQSVSMSSNSDVVSWNYPRLNTANPPDIITFTYTVGSTTHTASISGSDPSFSAQMSALAATGAAQLVPWKLTYRRANENGPYAMATGTASITKTGTQTNPVVTMGSQNPIYPSGVAVIPAPTDLGGDYFGWSSLSPDANSVIEFRLNNVLTPMETVGSGRRINFASLTPNTTYNYELIFKVNGLDYPYARAKGTFHTTKGPGAITNTGFSVGAPRAENVLDATPSFGTGTIVWPPTAVYHRVPFGQQGEHLEYGPMAYDPNPNNPSGGYEYIIPESIEHPVGTWRRWEPPTYQYQENAQMVSWTRDTGSETMARFIYWSTSTPAQTTSASVGAYDTAWRADLRSLTTDGTYGYRIELLRTGAVEPYAIQEGTFTRSGGGATRSITPTSNAAPTLTTVTPTQRQTFDRWGNLLETRDAAGNATNYRYNARDQLVQTLEAEDRILQYSSTGAWTDTPNARAEKTNYYDSLGRLIETQDGYDHAVRLTYNTAGQQLTKRNADHAVGHNAISSSAYDVFGNLIQSTDESNYKTRYKYDQLGRLVQIWREINAGGFTEPNNPNSTAGSADNLQTQYFVYDQAGRRVSETTGIDTEVTRYQYDHRGNVTMRISPTQAQYSVPGTILGTRYTYDLNGKMLSETDALGSVKSWTYNAFGRMETQTQFQNGTAAIAESSGATIDFDYNEAGALTGQTSNHGQNITYGYDTAGNLTSIIDLNAGINRQTIYRYDSAGRRSRESVYIDGRAHQETRITYDGHNRIRGLDDLAYRESIAYDSNGNRSYISVHYVDHEGHVINETYGYEYDEMNRVLKTTHWAPSPDINRYSVFTYNGRGDRLSASSMEAEQWERRLNGGTTTYHIRENTLFVPVLETYTYDGLARLKTVTRDIQMVTVTANGNMSYTDTTLVHDYVYDKANRLYTDTYSSLENNQRVERRTINYYDLDGRASETITYRGTNFSLTESVTRFGHSTRSGSNWSRGYDDAGNLRSYDVEFHDPTNGNITYTTTYKNTYKLGDGYLETRQDAHSERPPSSSTPLPLDAHTTREYNANGELTKFTDSGNADRTRYFANDQSGQTLTAIMGNFSTPTQLSNAWNSAALRDNYGGFGINWAKAQHYFFALGNLIGTFGQLQKNGRFAANFDVNYTKVSESFPGSVPTTVVAQAGDTLRSVAARVFGDASLWYILAEENGLTNPDADIPDGTQLRVPNDVISLSNNADSFKPFNPADALGDTTPTQPAPPPPKGGCGIVGMVIMAIVAIVVTVWTGFTVTAALNGIWTSAIGGVAASAVGAVAGGIAGSIASQGVGIALGMQSKFDWKQVAASGLSSLVTFGIGAGLDKLGWLGGQGILAFTGRAIINNAATQGVYMAMGLQKKFDWKSVAVTAISAPLVQGVGKLLNKGFATKASHGGKTLTTTERILSKIAVNATEAVIRKAVVGGKIDYINLVVDAFGTELGNSLIKVTADAAPPADASVSADEPTPMAPPSEPVETPTKTPSERVTEPRDERREETQRPAEDPMQEVVVAAKPLSQTEKDLYDWQNDRTFRSGIEPLGTRFLRTKGRDGKTYYHDASTGDRIKRSSLTKPQNNSLQLEASLFEETMWEIPEGRKNLLEYIGLKDLGDAGFANLRWGGEGTYGATLGADGVSLGLAGEAHLSLNFAEYEWDTFAGKTKATVRSNSKAFYELGFDFEPALQEGHTSKFFFGGRVGGEVVGVQAHGEFESKELDLFFFTVAFQGEGDLNLWGAGGVAGGGVRYRDGRFRMFGELGLTLGAGARGRGTLSFGANEQFTQNLVDGIFDYQEGRASFVDLVSREQLNPAVKATEAFRTKVIDHIFDFQESKFVDYASQLWRAVRRKD